MILFAVFSFQVHMRTLTAYQQKWKLISRILTLHSHQTTYLLSIEEWQNECSSAELYFNFTSDYLQPSNGRAIGCQWMLISRILISNPHQTTYNLVAIGNQQDEYLFQIHIRPLTCYQWKNSRVDTHQQDFHFKFALDYLQPINEEIAECILMSRILISNSYQTTYILLKGEQQDAL